MYALRFPDVPVRANISLTPPYSSFLRCLTASTQAGGSCALQYARVKAPFIVSYRLLNLSRSPVHITYVCNEHVLLSTSKPNSSSIRGRACVSGEETRRLQADPLTSR